MARLFATLLSLLILSLSTSSIAQRQVSARGTFHVTYRLYSGERLIGQPHFVLNDDSVATATANRLDGYSIRASLHHPADTADSIRQVDTEIYLSEHGKWVRIGHPFVSGLVDHEATVDIARYDMPRFRMMVTVNSNFDGKSLSSNAFGKNRCTTAKLESWKQKLSLPVSISTKKVQFPTVSQCCQAGCNQTCCSDGPICCGDYNCPGSGCCNH